MNEPYETEVYREEVEDLTQKIADMVRSETKHLSSVDTSIIVAATLANIACMQDECEFRNEGVTGRLASIVDMWRRGGLPQ